MTVAIPSPDFRFPIPLAKSHHKARRSPASRDHLFGILDCALNRRYEVLSQVLRREVPNPGETATRAAHRSGWHSETRQDTLERLARQPNDPLLVVPKSVAQKMKSLLHSRYGFSQRRWRSRRPNATDWKNRYGRAGLNLAHRAPISLAAIRRHIPISNGEISPQHHDSTAREADAFGAHQRTQKAD